jgi:hypothetical protein
MAKTFWAHCSVSEDYNTDTAAYIEKEWGVKLRVEDMDDHPSREILNVLGITVRDYPEIMTDIENSGYFEPHGSIWQINRISPEGITFYLVNYGGRSDNTPKHHVWEEVFIFIPMSNVVAVHNVSQRFFINESVRSIERQEKESQD